MCPICHNKTVYDVDKDVYRTYEVSYDDLCVCEECGSEMYARPQYDGTIKFEINTESCTSINADEYSNDTYWIAIYNDIDGNKHKIVFKFNSSDYDEAEEELDAVIQEPYTYSKLLGRAPLKLQLNG